MFNRIDRRLFTILMIVFVQIVGASMILPILPLYARDRFSMSDEVVTLLFSSFFLAQFLAGPLIGRLSDTYGRLPVLIISQIGTVISFVIIGLAPSVAWLFFARILDGITGGNIVVAQAYVTDIMPPKQR
ncbi:MAG TPA: MFS transporter, partial [Spirillospora sp.]|nr:MFS transporter [Spirillospora sp.]